MEPSCVTPDALVLETTAKQDDHTGGKLLITSVDDDPPSTAPTDPTLVEGPKLESANRVQQILAQNDQQDDIVETGNTTAEGSSQREAEKTVQDIDATKENEIPATPPPPPVVSQPPTTGKPSKRDDDKVGIYKALAIKLKKELVKTRDELQKLRSDSRDEIENLTARLKDLEQVLESERISSSTTIATLEATIRSLKSQLDSSETDLKSTQIEFEDYKKRASLLMQQNYPAQSSTVKTFEEERYKQLRASNQDLKNRIKDLEALSSSATIKKAELERENDTLRDQLESFRSEIRLYTDIEYKYKNLVRENENLKQALKKLSDSSTNANPRETSTVGEQTDIGESNEGLATTEVACDKTSPFNEPASDIATQLSPNASLKDDCNTNSSSSFDGSASGYVHIKPTTFEIISRSSLLEDAQNQIDSLTKAYLDSESTNSLLTEQVRALKEEIRRIQRGTERMDLAENLEYLKNVVFKFISLDNSQSEQRQRLVPVLSTVLKLSPDETAKLNAVALPEKTSMASSIFKLGGG